MKVLRTPQDRFADLPDFGYPPRYAEVDGLRLAYVETGPADGEPVLLHGEPSWSFLYRKVMPVLADAGVRAIAADLVGFGRSDKPAEIADHSFARHVEWIRALAFDHLDLRGLTLVGQAAASDMYQRCSSTSWKISAGGSRPRRSSGIAAITGS